MERQRLGLALRRRLSPRFGVSLTLDGSQRVDQVAFTESITTSRLVFHPEALNINGSLVGDSVLAPVTDARRVRTHSRHRLLTVGLQGDVRLLEGPAWSLRGLLAVRYAIATGFGGSRIGSPSGPGTFTPLTADSPYGEVSPWRFDVGLRAERRLSRRLSLLLDARGVVGARYGFEGPETVRPITETGLQLGGHVGLGYRF